MPEEAEEGARQSSSPRQKRTSGERVRSQGSRARRLARYQQVNELYQQGGTILGIARQLQIGAQTVRKFVHSPQFPEWGKPAVTRSAIDPYRTYLEERWRQGCQDAGPLWRELQARGFTGSWMMVYRWLQVRRDEPASASALQHKQVNRTPRRLAPRHLAWLFLRDPKHLKEEEKHALSLIHTSLPLDRAYELSQQFVAMFKERNAQQLASWLRACQLSEISDLVTFAQRLELERSALQAALTLPWSNGPVEGKINKLKYIKRSMYGRSGFPLLRQKVLNAG